MTNSTQDTWWMIERDDDPKHRPLYFCWVHRPGELPHTAPHGEHGWTPDWQRGEHFATREEAEAHTNGDPMLRVCDHAMMRSAMTQDTEDVVARLRRQAEQTSKIHREMAEAKSLRQTDNPEGRTDLYEWPTPEQTIEGKAADLIQSLSDRIDVLEVDDVAEILWLYAREKMRLVPKLLPAERQDFRDKARSIIESRAALHQEGIASGGANAG